MWPPSFVLLSPQFDHRWIVLLLLQALPAFHLRHPAIQVQLREIEWGEQLAAIGRREIDMGLGRESSVPPQGWRFEPLQPDTFEVVCGPQHPLAHKRRLRWQDLQDQTWLVPPVDALNAAGYGFYASGIMEKLAATPYDEMIAGDVVAVCSSTAAAIRAKGLPLPPGPATGTLPA